ncbi:MAG: alanine--tRNA ligase [Actinobacteria bacterium]|nr:MAG: alanine--tRNA ligase [Actinomycetota bacterium]
MRAADIRRAFLEFFRARDHRIVPSSSLVPDDPSAPLLTTAGMVQFIPYFIGRRPIEFPRAASCQKSARTTDIDIVGLDARHQTFFEMLGNFSFGDYFKSEAIRYAWDLSTEEFKLEPDRIWVTVFETDDEAERIWREEIGLPAERVIRRGREDNFWWMGVPGPGGPCSEMFYDRGPKYGEVDGFQDGDRIMEYWNLVFTEFRVDERGEPVGELPRRNVDTGLGLERMAAILQDVPGGFETDIFRPLIERAEQLTGARYSARYEPDATTDVSLRIVAEHSRFATFLIGDGVFPSNEGRGYILRRVIRRAARHARLLGVTTPVMAGMVDAVVATMGDVYPEIAQRKEMIAATIEAEESNFGHTLDKGLTLLETGIDEAKRAGKSTLSGDTTFKLHDTYGFPLELTLEIAREHGLDVDSDAFASLMKEQQERARAGMKKVSASGEGALREILSERGPTTFVGYERTDAETAVGGIVRDGERVPAAAEGDEVDVVLDATPFYAEGGGQVGDRGIITAAGAMLEVLDTQPALDGLIVHRARVRSGEAQAGSEAHAVVDAARRAAVARSHTATHVLHATLREALGPHAHQAGSLVDAGRLRFDFPHNEAVPKDLLSEVEETVVRRILVDDVVRPYETTRDEAAAIGAMALFGEKYGDIVRVVEIGDYSVELCGGTHVMHTSQVGAVKILGEASIGSGLRRVEALTGAEAIEGYRHDRALLEQIASLVKGSPDEAADKVRRILDELKAARAELERSRSSSVKDQAGALAAKAEPVGDASLVVAEVPGLGVGDLGKLAMSVREALRGPGAVVLGSGVDGKAGVAAAVSKDLVGRGISAKAILAGAAKAVGGGAGGKDDLATGGGNRPDGIAEALRLAGDAAREALGG